MAAPVGFAASSTTRISTDMEDLWRRQFFTLQQRTPVATSVDAAPPEPQDRIWQVTGLRFAQGAGNPAIIPRWSDECSAARWTGHL
jgi:hypothetical protein